MLNVKLVIIGASGVGKTSLRTKYTSGRFSPNYRATIGADFITKTIPHHSLPEETVQLQIWDTAGQERFSSLATAFFRGADAVILVYDVTDPSSLQSLTKWWDEFRTRAPVEEGLEAEFPVAVVGNKMDLIEGRNTGTWKRKHQRLGSGSSIKSDTIVTEAEARDFLQDLIGVPDNHDQTSITPAIKADTVVTNGSSNPNGIAGTSQPSEDKAKHSSTHQLASQPNDAASTPSPIPHPSRLITRSIRDETDSRATSRSRYGNGTMTSTAVSVYHTAASSLVDSAGSQTPTRVPSKSSAFWDPEVEEAIAANSAGQVGEGEIALDSGYRSVTPIATPNGVPSKDPMANGPHTLGVPVDSSNPSTRQRVPSSTSNSSTQTVTPSKVNPEMEVASPLIATDQNQTVPLPPKHTLKPPRSGPGLFFASAKTGEGLSEAFQYIGNRVTQKWEWEESRLNMVDGDASTSGDSRIILRGIQDGNSRADGKDKWSCC